MSKKTKMLYFIMGVTLIGLLVFGGYKFYQSKTTIEKFNSYIEAYKKEVSMYDLIDKESEYTKIITESEQALSEKNYKLISDLKEKAELLKEELLRKNIEIAEEKIKQLESIDISKLDNKDSINSSIEELKNLKESHNFIKINETFNSLLEEINVKIAETEEIEKQKKQEELLNNIDGAYVYENLNKYGVPISEIQLQIISYGDNKLYVTGGHNAITNIGGDIEKGIDDITFDDLGYVHSKSGSLMEGYLDYNGDFSWSGFIYDDQGYNGNIYYNSGYFSTIPIAITIDNTNLIVNIGEKASSVAAGTHTFKRQDDESFFNYTEDYLSDLKKTLSEEYSISPREAYDLVNQHGNPPERYEKLNIYDEPIGVNGDWWFEFPDGEYYQFVYEEPIYFLVNKESGLVYSFPSQIGLPIHLMKNGEIEKTYEWNNEAYEANLE